MNRSTSVPLPSTRVLPALRLLLDGYQYANDVGAPLMEFAISIETMRQFSVAEIDIRWLTRKGYAVAICDEKPLPCDSTADFSSHTIFIASVDGLRYAQEILDVQVVAMVPKKLVPCWDSAQRKLKLGDCVVKRFHVPAPNQELILSSFQEESWPPHIADPIPPVRKSDPKRRLSDTILALNRCQAGQRIRFRGDGTGTGVYWEIES